MNVAVAEAVRTGQAVELKAIVMPVENRVGGPGLSLSEADAGPEGIAMQSCRLPLAVPTVSVAFAGKEIALMMKIQPGVAPIVT